MKTVFLTLLRISVNAGWLVLAVLLLRIIFQRAPGWMRCVFWGPVACCLVCPVSVVSPWSLRPDTGRIFEKYVQLDSVRSSVALESGGIGVEGLSVWSVFAIVWLVGMTAMLLYLLISFRRLGRGLAMAASVSESDVFCRKAGEHDTWRRQTPLPRRIVQSGRIDTPFVFGVFRPVICLPRRMEARDRDYAIAHEQAHIDRKDHWWKLFGFVLLAVYWFHPLLWAAYALFCRDIETACDEKVLRDMDLEERRAYASAMLRCSAGRREPAAFPAFGEAGVKSRIRHVMDYRSAPVWMIVAAAAACMVTAIALLTEPEHVAGQSAAEARVTAENIWQVVDSLDESRQREPVFLYVVCETGNRCFLVSRSIGDFWDRKILLDNGDSRYILAVPYDSSLYYVGEIA